jgi:mannose-6-phosphate isomerase-like protein (cupin superfamily)
VLQGEGVKHVGDDGIRVRGGEIVFVPQNNYHALENTSDTDTLVTIWATAAPAHSRTPATCSRATSSMGPTARCGVE